MSHSGAAISENPAGMSPPLTTIKRERNSLEELINFGLWKEGRRGEAGSTHALPLRLRLGGLLPLLLR